ncbi:MAG: sugar-binding domain-containing protein [Planctomycetota bacterium]
MTAKLMNKIIRSTVIISAGMIICITGKTSAKPRSLSAVTPEQKREVLSLAGKWSFQQDRENVGEKEKWYENKLSDSIKLPGSMTENGYGDDISTSTKWTGLIVNRSWFTDPEYEKYRQAGSVKIPFWLTPLKHYIGLAWYQRQVHIPENWRGKRIVLFLERSHWETKVWVDGVDAGIEDSLCTPQQYDLSKLMTPGKHLLAIRVDNSIKYDVGINAHSISDHTQTNWNGIVGRIELQATDPVWIKDIQIHPDLKNKSAKLRVTIVNPTGRDAAGTVTVRAESWNTDRKHTVRPRTAGFTTSGDETAVEIDYDMGDDVMMWDEFSPALYKLTVSIAGEGENILFGDRQTVTFGMRNFGTKGTQFIINDRPVFLRGTLECCIFPLTGYPDMNVEGWLRIFRIAKAYGLNHMRFHSWCPPEAAFDAADRMGFALQVECATWSTVGDGKPIDKFIYAESDRILQTYGNHPSFCMLAYGNEPGGRNQRQFLSNLINYWKDKDSRRVYTSGAGWPIIPESQYHSDHNPRGHLWGAGLTSRFNAKPPETATDYRSFVEKYDAPLVSHEIGQWCAYPNFRETKKYTGVLRASNFEIFRDSLARHHMLDEADDFLKASGKLQAKLYKEEIESALRTPGFGGFQLLDIHDFPGQGTALVGVLDAFWDSKGYIRPEEFQRFCSETVPLLRMQKRIWTTAETFSADAEIAHFGPAPIQNTIALWSVNYPDGREAASGKLLSLTIPIGNGTVLGKIEAPLANIAAPTKLVVSISIKDTPFTNHWDIWVYPAGRDTKAPKSLLIAEDLGEEVLTALKTGMKVLLMPPLDAIDSNIPAGFSTIFWNTAWTNGQPPHTLGILCNPEHPALAKFPTEFHSNWQWWDLVTKSRFMVLNDFASEFRPIVQVIDDWNTNRKLGLILEARIGKGKLLVCSIDLRCDLEIRPVARQMLHSLLNYMDSDAFAPRFNIDIETIRSLLKKPSSVSNVEALRMHSKIGK